MKAYTLTPVNPVNPVNSFNPVNPVKCMSHLCPSRLSSRLSFVCLVRLSRLCPSRLVSSRLCPSRLVCAHLVSSVPAPLNVLNPLTPLKPEDIRSV